MLKKKLEVAVSNQSHRQSRSNNSTPYPSNGQVVPTEIKTCAAIINIFHLIPAATTKVIEPLTSATLKGEKSLYLEVKSLAIYYRDDESVVEF